MKNGAGVVDQSESVYCAVTYTLFCVSFIVLHLFLSYILLYL